MVTSMAKIRTMLIFCGTINVITPNLQRYVESLHGAGNVPMQAPLMIGHLVGPLRFLVYPYKDRSIVYFMPCKKAQKATPVSSYGAAATELEKWVDRRN